MLLSSHRNVPMRAIYLLLLTKEIIATPEVEMQFLQPTTLEYIALLKTLVLVKLE